jgi:hypothetical protein
LPKDDTDAILDANRVIREAHEDVCKSASDCLEKAQAALERVKLEGSEHGENMLFNETIHQAEDAVVEAMAANHTACDLWDNALCNELLNKPRRAKCCFGVSRPMETSITRSIPRTRLSRRQPMDSLSYTLATACNKTDEQCVGWPKIW